MVGINCINDGIKKDKFYVMMNVFVSYDMFRLFIFLFNKNMNKYKVKLNDDLVYKIYKFD